MKKKLLRLDPSCEFSNNNYNASPTSPENSLPEAEQRCQCREQVICKSNLQGSKSKSSILNQDVTLEQVQYLCKDLSNQTFESEKGKKSLQFKKRSMLSNAFNYF